MQRMSGIDPMFVYSETPATPMEVAYACVFDPSTAPRTYSFAGVREVLAERVPTLVPFRRRLMPVPLGLDHPRWVDDPEFDLDNHLHRVALPAPGGEAELLALVARVMGRPLQPAQPPWEMHIIEGLEGNRVGLIAKMHHAVIDGVSGVQLMAQLLDLSADGRPLTDITPAPWAAPALPSTARLVTDAIPNLLTSPIRAVRALREIGRTAVRLGWRALDSESGPLSMPRGAPDTFETPVGAGRSVAFAALNLGNVRAVKERFEVTLNDVVLAVCSGALRAHLAEPARDRDLPRTSTSTSAEAASSLVAVVPVSVRGRPAQGDLGNRLSAMFVPLCNDRLQPSERLRDIAATTSSAKAQERAVGYGPMAAALSEAIPPALARPMIQFGIQHGALRRLRAGNLLVSNVPGPDVPLYFAGMRMEAAYPLGPVVDGVALNITVQTYRDALFVGLNACASAVPDLPGLARAMVAELGHLVDAAEIAQMPAA